MQLGEIHDKPIVLVLGKMCTGKGVYCEKAFPGMHKIVVSDIVKSFSGAKTRSQLTRTKHLDQIIADEIIRQIHDHERVVVDGIRQKSIIQRIVDEFGEDNIDVIWLQTSEDEMRRRYYRRGSKKDDQPFETALAKDEELGLGDVERWATNRPLTKIVDH